MSKSKSRRKNYKTQGYISSKTPYIDTSTGEVINNYDSPHIGDINFYKIWLSLLLDVLYECNSVGKVLAYMLNNMNKRTNALLITQEKIKKDLSMSYSTVSRALNTLKKVNIITYANSTYMINPDFIFQGYNSQRNIAINDFNRIPHHTPRVTKKACVKRIPIITESISSDTNIKPKNQKVIDAASKALRRMNKE